jgi:hypothetical protein
MIYFDIDGVVRDLLTLMGANPQHWDFEHNGETLIQFYDRYLYRLRVAPVTEYYDTITQFTDNPTFITRCKESWRLPTHDWLSAHFATFRCIFVNEPEEKLNWLQEGDFLVEDYPGFSDYSQIILIDTPYNQNVYCERRVRTPAELWLYLADISYQGREA